MNESLDITKSSGETLAEILGQEFQRIMQSKNNIDVIQKELERRKNGKTPEVKPGPTPVEVK